MEDEAVKEMTRIIHKENTPVDLTGTQKQVDDCTVDDPVNDHRLSTQIKNDPYENRKKDVPVEVDIKYLKHPVTACIFEVNSTIIKQRHLIPCDKKGKPVHDNRVFGRFN